jgi:hypothetical protein
MSRLERPLAHRRLQTTGDVRAAKRQGDGPMAVRFAAGTYYLAEPLVLGPEDSGTAERPIAYAAAPGGTSGWRLRPA